MPATSRTSPAALSLVPGRWRELGDVMRALERASFAPAIPSDVIALADEAEVLAQSLDPKREEQG